MTKPELFKKLKTLGYKRSSSIQDYENAKSELLRDLNYIEYARRAKWIAEWLHV